MKIKMGIVITGPQEMEFDLPYTMDCHEILRFIREYYEQRLSYYWYDITDYKEEQSED